ncbi:uncharacterized protein F5147DRAFT_652908 [Suillus discolor]|uniref:Importin subunit beta-1/Transportin-1-like TPR repeats domain-containing protein n=1 Tax=Suillus discolor TaxID=1912936 RepID=A0A9P7F849_9AGAM|nr:uncharacterized protein F5147DRAFT_652908 [Suillus discolor]KAG2108185.1 hypothetical protein F5147DRAFT_652908 [Suillus discolor]
MAEFRYMLHITSAVINGSCAMQMWRDNGGHPANLNIVVPSDSGPLLAEFIIKTLHYNKLPDTHINHSYAKVVRCHCKFQCGDLKITMSEALADGVFKVIMASHTTADMTLMTAGGMTVFYPLWTLRHITVTNCAGLHPAPGCTIGCFSQEGWEVRSCTFFMEGPCGLLCPALWRNVADAGRNALMIEWDPRFPMKRLAYHSNVMWHLSEGCTNAECPYNGVANGHTCYLPPTPMPHDLLSIERQKEIIERHVLNYKERYLGVLYATAAAIPLTTERDINAINALITRCTIGTWSVDTAWNSESYCIRKCNNAWLLHDMDVGLCTQNFARLCGMEARQQTHCKEVESLDDLSRLCNENCAGHTNKHDTNILWKSTLMIVETRPYVLSPTLVLTAQPRILTQPHILTRPRIFTPPLCMVAIGIIEDISRAPGDQSAQYAGAFMNVLLKNLQSNVLGSNECKCFVDGTLPQLACWWREHSWVHAMLIASSLPDSTHGSRNMSHTDTPMSRVCLGPHGNTADSVLDACSYKNIPEENNPHPLRRQMGDKAEYWVNGFGELLHMKFMARLDYHGQYSHLGPYFNLFDSGIDVSNLKKTRAQFELHFLALEDDDSGDYPQEALDMSCRVLDTLSALTTAVEDRCNAGVLEVEHPVVSPFMREYTRDSKDCFVLVMQSEPLFRDLPNEGSATTPRVSHEDIGKSGVLLSPSKAKQLARASAAARSSCAANTSSSGGNVALSTSNLAVMFMASTEFLCIHDLHDPDNHYSGLGSLKETKVECPDVHDGNGLLIHPREYGIKLARAQWNINKIDKDDVSDRKRLGSQNYQLILRRMQLLPCMGYAKAEILKGKRKASEKLADPLHAKKLAVTSGQDDSMDEL